MADDIVKRKLLIGRDTNYVKRLLTETKRYMKEEQRWIYELGGTSTNLGFMDHHLVIRLTDGKVDSVRHYKFAD